MAETGVERQAGIWSASGKFMRLAARAGALLYTGCQSIIPTGAPTGPEIPTPTPTPMQPGLPTDTERHRIALLVPMSGPNAGVGNSIANATTLAQLDTKTQNVRITTYDTNSGIAAAAQKAISEGNKRTTEESRIGQAGVRTCRCRWWSYHSKQNSYITPLTSKLQVPRQH